MGDFSSCISTYEELLENYEVDSDDLKGNIIAAYVSGGRSRDAQGVMDSMKVSAKISFSLAYNAVCALIERGDLSGAEEHFLLARRCVFLLCASRLKVECPFFQLESCDLRLQRTNSCPS